VKGGGGGVRGRVRLQHPAEGRVGYRGAGGDGVRALGEGFGACGGRGGGPGLRLGGCVRYDGTGGWVGLGLGFGLREGHVRVIRVHFICLVVCGELLHDGKGL